MEKSGYANKVTIYGHESFELGKTFSHPADKNLVGEIKKIFAIVDNGIVHLTITVSFGDNDLYIESTYSGDFFIFWMFYGYDFEKRKND